MVTVAFYVNHSSKNVIDKNLTSAGNATGQWVEGTSWVSPTVRLAKNAWSYANNQPNFARIEAFGRYYYIADKRTYGNYTEIDLVCDVLMSYKDFIKSGKIFVNTAEKDYNLGLVNAGLNQPAIDTVEQYGYDLNGPDFVPEGGRYILTVAG